MSAYLSNPQIWQESWDWGRWGYSNTMTGRAGIYGRNSKGEAKSIEDQLVLGRAAVAREGWTLAGEYSDDSSASAYRKKERDDWPRLLADLAAGALDYLVLWNPSRGSRDEVDWFLMLRQCKQHGVLIHVMAHRRTYDPRVARDWKTLAEDGVSSAFYSAELSENVRRGVSQAAVNGGPHGRVAFGYTRAYDAATGRPGQAPNSDALIVREIFDRLAALTPISALEKEFRARELPSPSGGPWRRNTIRIIATNIAYIGKRAHGGETYDATWGPVVDEGVFWKVQGILNRPERRTTKPGAAKYLLSYIATTPCGGQIKNNPASRPDRADRYACEHDGCVSIARPDADALVERIVIERLERPDARDLLVADDSGVEQAEAELSRYRAQLEEARQSFERPDGISAEALARKERALGPLITDAEERARPAGASILDVLVGAPDVRAVWDGLSVAARREVVAVLADLTVTSPTRRLSRHASEEERHLEAFLRLKGSRWAGEDETWG